MSTNCFQNSIPADRLEFTTSTEKLRPTRARFSALACLNIYQKHVKIYATENFIKKVSILKQYMRIKNVSSWFMLSYWTAHKVKPYRMYKDANILQLTCD